MSERRKNYEKKHAFFSLTEEEDQKNSAHISKIPDAVGRIKFLPFQSRFDDQNYSDSVGEGNSKRSLVIKILPVKYSARTLQEVKNQILYIGRMLKSDEKLDVLFTGENDINGEGAKVVSGSDLNILSESSGTKLYDQNFRLMSRNDVIEVAQKWIKDFHKNEVISRHILFSIGGKEDPAKALAATKLFFDDVFRSKGYDYFFAAHYDTANDHFHVIIKKRNNLGVNLRFNKNDVFILRQKYANYLEKVGIKRQIVARVDNAQVLQKIENKEEHLKNNNTHYQSRLNKGNQRDFNAYYYKANLTGRIEEEISVLKVKIALKSIGVDEQNVLNRLRKNVREEDGLTTITNAILAVKQMQEKRMKIDNLTALVIHAVEKRFKPNTTRQRKTLPKEEKKIFIPELSQEQVQAKFKEAILDFFSKSESKENIAKELGSAVMSAFAKTGSKIRFGEKKNCEIVWYGKAGYVMDYKSGEVLRWGINKIKREENLNFRAVSSEEAQLIQEKENILNEAQKAEKIKKAEEVAKKAQLWFDKYQEWTGEKNNYLNKKGILDSSISGIKLSGDMIVIPARDVDGKIWSLQYIEPDGSKKFLSGSKKTGNFFLLGKDSVAESDTIFLAEGFATAATIHKATGKNVVVCFDTNNIEKVFENWAQKYPEKSYVIMADNDLWKVSNTGREKAENLVQKYQDQYDVKMILPQFSLADKDLTPTDFNDLQNSAGLEEVINQINNGLNNQASQQIVIAEKIAAKEKDEAEEVLIEKLTSLKSKIVDLADKRDIKQQVDLVIKEINNIDQKVGKLIDDKINNDEVKYGYVQPKKEVDLSKLQLKNSVKVD